MGLAARKSNRRPCRWLCGLDSGVTNRIKSRLSSCTAPVDEVGQFRVRTCVFVVGVREGGCG